MTNQEKTASFEHTGLVFFVRGVRKDNVGFYLDTKEIIDGTVVFYLTDTRLPSGGRCFKKVFNPEGLLVTIGNKKIVHPWQVSSVSEDQTTLTIDVNKLIINFRFLTVGTAPNGQAVQVMVIGEPAD